MKQKEETIQSHFEEQNFTNMTIKLANAGCKCPETTVLKLKIINLSSQNHLFRRKITELQQSLKNLSPYKIAFENLIKATRQLILQQGISESRVSEELNKIIQKESKGQQSSISTNKNMLTTKDSEVDPIRESTPIIKTEGNFSPENKSIEKIDQFPFNSRLTQNDERDTVKSLDFSLESHQEREEEKHSPQYLKDYQTVKARMEAVYDMKNQLLIQELEDLKRENQQLRNRQRRQKQGRNDNQVQNQRQTAYFQECWDHISQQQQQESIGQLEQSSISSKQNRKEGLIQPLKIEKLLPLSLQIKSLKLTFSQLRAVLTSELAFLLQSFYELKAEKKEVKVISIDEYLSMVESKKQEKVYLSQYSACLQEIERLKSIVRKFI